MHQGSLLLKQIPDPTPRNGIHLDTEDPRTQSASSLLSPNQWFQVSQSLLLSITVSRAPGRQRDGVGGWGSRRQRAPEALAWWLLCAPHPQQTTPTAQLAAAHPPSLAPAGQLPSAGAAGRCTLWKLVSLLFLLRCPYLVSRNPRGMTVPAENPRSRALQLAEAPRG